MLELFTDVRFLDWFLLALKSGLYKCFILSFYVKDMFERNKYGATLILISFIAAFRDWESGYTDEKKNNTVHEWFSDMVNYFVFILGSVILSTVPIYS